MDGFVYFLSLFSGGDFVSVNGLDRFVGNDDFILVRDFGFESF